jgi:hypothetical protein
VLTSGDIWEVAKWRSLSKLWLQSSFLYGFFAAFMFGKNCSQLQVFQKGISWVVCCYWALGTHYKVNRVYRTEEVQHLKIYFVSFCMNADKIIIPRISHLFVAFFWNMITGRTANVEWPHAIRVSHFAHHYLTATHSFLLHVIKPFITVSPSAISFLPVC